MDVSDMSVATSGNYEKYVMIGGKRYSHTIDPRLSLCANLRETCWPSLKEIIASSHFLIRSFIFYLRCKIQNMPLAIGSKAPAFSLFNTDRKLISLADYAGKPLIINFFPAAFTGVCTEQMCTNRDDMSFYSELGVNVIGLSVDMPFSLKAFKEQNKIGFDLLSDFNKQTIHEYEMYHSNFSCGIRGVAKRGVVLIDKNGLVAYTEETANPGTQVNFAALKEALKKLN
jgi:peroxiredoxin